MKQLVVIICAMGIIFSSCGKKSVGHKKFSNLGDSAAYFIGISEGKGIKASGYFDELNVDLLAQGMKDAFYSDSLKYTDQEIQEIMSGIIQKLRMKILDKNEKEGKKFLEENKTKPNVKVTPSGLQYIVLKEGTGPMPDSSSTVKVHYTLYHVNGKKIQSSVGGQPATFPVTGVIRGWTEALLKMKVGSKWKLFIPTDLAYGMNPDPRSEIRPNEALVFEVELLSIEQPQQPEQPAVPQATVPKGK